MKYRGFISWIITISVACGIINIPSAALADDSCIRITAEYDENGRLMSAHTVTISRADITPVNNTDTNKVFYWDSLESMKPIAVEQPTATELPPMSTPTEVSPAPTIAVMDADYTFVFGGTADGAIEVNADDSYSARENGMTYGFYGIEGAPDVSDGRTDGFKNTDTDPYTVLKNGDINGKPYITADYGSYSEDVILNMAGGVMPVRFSVKAEEHRYYTVTATVVNTSETENAEITLYSEKRHAVMAGKMLAPGECVTKTWNVNLESVYYNAGGIKEDDQLNICVVGRNAGLSTVSVKKHDTMGKTIWLCTDSTGCDQPAELPYYPLRNYSGTGSLLTKYINPEIAVSNQGEGGLTAGDNNHFNNAVAHMNKGDYLYVQYGLNDRSAGTAKFKENLEKYYIAAKQKEVNLIIVSPSDRRNSWDSTNKKWQSVAAPFAEASKEFVEDKIANDNAENIAYIDLNTNFIDWMNEVEDTILAQRQRLGFADTAVDERAIIYYYLADRQSGVDSIHINDYGTDNAAYIVMREAKKIVEAGNTEGAAESEKRQAKVLSELVVNMGGDLPCAVSDEIVAAGWPMNSFYPYPSSAEVSYQYPSMVKSVNAADGVLKSMTVMVQGSANKYYQGCADILNPDGTVKETVYTTSTSANPAIGHIDNTSAKYGDMVTMYFDDVEIPSGGSYRAYVKGKENGADAPDDEYYSSVFTEPEAVIDNLITAPDGISADSFDYGIAEGEGIIGKGAGGIAGANAWVFAGSSGDKRYNTAAKDGTSGAVFAQNGSGTYTLCKYFNGYKQIKEGKLKLHFRINYILGSFTLKLAQTGKIASWLDGIEAVRISDGEIILPDNTTAGKIKNGKWTDIDLTLDIDRGTEELSIAGGDGVSCNIAKLQTSVWSDTEKLLPIKGFAITATENPSTIPTYPFEFYLTEMLVTTVETDTPHITVSAESEDVEKGAVTGGGEVRINSDVVLTASENDGYAFTGWYKDGEIYSKENPLTLEKLRDDITLTARFEVQKSKEDAASFEITADKSAVRRDSSIKLSITNARDADGNKVSGLEAGDIEWTTDESGINIDNGIVSFSEAFAIDENTNKTVTIHGIYKTAAAEIYITIYSYAYFEEINSAATDFTGGFAEIASKECIVFPSTGSAVYTLTDSVSLDKETTITYNSAYSGSNTSGNNRTLEFLDNSGKTVFSVVYSWNGLKVNETGLTNTVFKNSFNPVTIRIDPVNNTVTVTAKDSGGNEKSAQTALGGASLSAIRFATTGTVPADRLIGISDITIIQ